MLHYCTHLITRALEQPLTSSRIHLRTLDCSDTLLARLCGFHTRRGRRCFAAAHGLDESPKNFPLVHSICTSAGPIVSLLARILSAQITALSFLHSFAHHSSLCSAAARPYVPYVSGLDHGVIWFHGSWCHGFPPWPQPSLWYSGEAGALFRLHRLGSVHSEMKEGGGEKKGRLLRELRNVCMRARVLPWVLPCAIALQGIIGLLGSRAGVWRPATAHEPVAP